MEKTYELLNSICKIPAISGAESLTLNAFKDLFGASFDEIHSDNVGNIIMVKHCGKAGAKKIVLDAHLDTVGFMVTAVHDDGFLSICPIGGIDTRILPAQEVCVYGKKEVYGVITSIPPHLSSGSGVPEIKDLYVDTGINDKDIHNTIEIGDYVGFKQEICRANGNYVFASGLDDRACLCSCIKAVCEAKELEYDVYIVASSFEETGAMGVKAAVFGIEPDIVIATDVNFARENGIEPRYSIECKKGPSVDLSSILDRALSKAILKLAKENNIPCQVIVEAGRTGTNADAISITGKGTKLALMSLPLKAMHTSCECVNLFDVKALADILNIVISTKEEQLWS